MTAAEQLAAFVSSLTPEQLPEAAWDACGRVLLDTYAVAIAGRHEDASELALRYARRGGVAGRDRSARCWGTGEMLPVELAALCNGVAGHVLDYDDVTSPMRGHPSIALLPALLALGEAIDATGAELACAYVAGFEVICRISKAIAVRHYAKGWHSTSSIGTLGAAAACARLLRLDARQATDAIGLAVSQAAGARANFGTHAKSFQAGQANAAGLRAALLASEGFGAAPGVLDEAFGYLDLYAHGESLQAQLDALGREPLELLASGIEVKKYPLCYATHRTLDGVLDLRAEHRLTLADVRSVHVRTSAGALTPLIYTRPQTGLEGKFSMQYAVAAALLDGHIGLASFTDEAVQRRTAQDFFAQVTTDDATEGATFPRWCEITLELRNGPKLSRRVEALRGSADAPLTHAQLREKVEDCLAWGRARIDVDRLTAGAMNLRGVRVREWLDTAVARAD